MFRWLKKNPPDGANLDRPLVKWVRDTFTARTGVSLSRQLFALFTAVVCFVLVYDVLKRPIGPSSAAIVASMSVALGAIWGLGKVRPLPPPGGAQP